MHALVAESNVVTRVTLRRILERNGFSTEEVHDELGAACVFQQKQPPVLALLATDTLLADFELVCEAIRAEKPDILIVALVPDSRRHELISVLNSGADDFMIKPVTIQEVEARIHVIQRLLIERGLVAPAALKDQPQSGPLAHEPATEPGTLSRLFPEFNVPALLEEVFHQMGTGPTETRDLDVAESESYLSAWCPVITRRGNEAEWLNIRLDIDRPNADALFNLLLKKPTFSEPEFIGLLKEILALVQDHVQNLMPAGLELYQPILPRVMPAEEFPALRALASGRARLQVRQIALKDKIRLRLFLSAEPVRFVPRRVPLLKKLDVLATPIQTVDETRMFLRSGIILSDVFIEKIVGFTLSHNLARDVTVLRPPAGMAVFLHNLLDE
jgi:CheY-like chemotaxis protein